MGYAIEDREDKDEQSEEGQPTEPDVINIDRFDLSVHKSELEIKGWVDKIDGGTNRDGTRRARLRIPIFQRSFVWDRSRASKLIESFLLGLPVPPIAIFQERGSNEFLVIDGQQRLLSIYFFYKGKFPKGNIDLTSKDYIADVLEDTMLFEDFKLKNVAEKFVNNTYDELSDNHKNILDGAVLSAFNIRQLNPEVESSIFYIFERLNTGGVSLTPMEIRKALYYGNFYELLDGLNSFDPWQKIIGFNPNSKLQIKIKNIERILRIFALLKWKDYKEPYTEHLNKHMRDNRQLTKEQFAEKKDIFERACSLVYKSLGEKPFHIPNRYFSISVMDSFMATTINNLGRLNETIVRKLYDSVRDNNEFLEILKERVNVKGEIVEKRFSLTERILNEILDMK